MEVTWKIFSSNVSPIWFSHTAQWPLFVSHFFYQLITSSKCSVQSGATCKSMYPSGFLSCNPTPDLWILGSGSDGAAWVALPSLALQKSPSLSALYYRWPWSIAQVHPVGLILPVRGYDLGLNSSYRICGLKHHHKGGKLEYRLTLCVRFTSEARLVGSRWDFCLQTSDVHYKFYRFYKRTYLYVDLSKANSSIHYNPFKQEVRSASLFASGHVAELGGNRSLGGEVSF